VVPVGFQVYDEATDTQEQRTDRLEVVGLLEASDNFFAMGAGGRLEPEALDAWRTEQNGGDLEFYGTVLVALADGADVESGRADLRAAPGLADASVQTVSELAAERTARETGSNVTFLVVMLGFAAVALSVAGLVIANTFQVLVAQRARTLALLRCVGAGTGQVYRTVLLEAAAVGLVSSVLGLAAGALAVQGALLIAPAFDLGVTLPTTVTPSAPVLLLPLGVGVLVTLLAAVAPARA